MVLHHTSAHRKEFFPPTASKQSRLKRGKQLPASRSHRRTFEFVVLRVCREQAVGEQLGESETSVFGSVFHIVPHCGLELLHELRRWRTKLLNHLIPLIDIWAGPQLGKKRQTERKQRRKHSKHQTSTSRTNQVDSWPSLMWISPH